MDVFGVWYGWLAMVAILDEVKWSHPDIYSLSGSFTQIYSIISEVTYIYLL